MLVVMGIILLLIALLLPAIQRAYQTAMRTGMAADLQVISEALDSYRTQFGDYPRSGSSPAVGGPRLLCWALIAPGPATSDGADGPGFRIRGTQGTIYGPYLPMDRFPIGTLSGDSVIPVPTGTAYSDTSAIIGDRYNHVILYCPAYTSVNPTTKIGGSFTVGSTPTSYYNYSDISGYVSGGYLTSKVFAYRLGDPGTGTIVPATTAPYILWSAGPDGAFGPQTALTNDPVTGVSDGLQHATGQDDDVTYPELNQVPVGFVP
jgi:type II secretory pathway pseudopilin PulG